MQEIEKINNRISPENNLHYPVIGPIDKVIYI